MYLCTAQPQTLLNKVKCGGVQAGWSQGKLIMIKQS